MKCYYEELGVARDANDVDIKMAYRKLALRWHPDKNPDNLEEAKEKFQTLQQAYEVLSDQHERAWYDNHREQILRGKNSDYEENCLDLFQYFTVSCFKGYGDDAKGFYKTYAEVFENIAAEDAEFMDDEEEIEEIPKFGDSQSSYEEVVGPFYAYWQSYCTKKTYTWLCPYDITEIKDRRVLREIEKDMKKIVQKAKRERNEEVRNLVSFIRKRDKRVQANKKLLEEKAAINRQKQEQIRLEQIRKRNRELEEMRKTNHAFNEGYEEQLKQLQQEYGEEFDSDSEDDEDGDSQELNELTEDMNFDDDDELQYADDLYCVACNRAFTNENAFMNHETSKKHRDNIERLKREMQDEEKSFEESINQEEKLVVPPLAEEDNLDGLDDDLDGLDVKEEVELASNKKGKGKKNKKGKKPPKATIELEEVAEAHEVDEIIDQINGKDVDEDDDEWGKGKKPAKKSKNKKPQKKATTEEPKLSQTEEPSEKLPNNKTESAAPSVDTNHICVTCKSTFESKNKLFAHLKKTNHGVYIPKAKPQTADNQPTKKSKGKRK